VATQGQAIEGIEILGIGTAAGKPLVRGTKVDIHVYFHVTRPTTTAYQFQLVAWPVDPAAPPADPAPDHIYRTAMRLTADGTFATDHWRAGDHIRERFSLFIPPGSPGNGLAVGLVAEGPTGGKLKATGTALASDPSTAVLGVLPLGPEPK